MLWTVAVKDESQTPGKQTRLLAQSVYDPRTFETKRVTVINCFKKFTFSLPLEPKKHKLALYKSVRAAALSVYRVMIYTFQMGDYRTAVRRSEHHALSSSCAHFPRKTL